MTDAPLGEFDLNPDPRVLPMLGEINLELWRCIAELTDNAVDGFLNVLRAGTACDAPEVRIWLPTAITDNATVRVRDNGPGMTADVLEMAVRAGWTGNNPIDSLGLFGMGFNIATARLGGSTTVWTTQAGDTVWHGVEIDFEQLRQQRHFRTPHLTRPKPDPTVHGTEVTVARIKAEHLQQLVRPAQQNRMRDQLARSYSSMLRENGTPITFSLYLGDRRLSAIQHCVWGEDRSVPLPDLGIVNAVLTIDRTLPARRYCTYCMRWLGGEETTCGTANCNVIERPRRVHGWVGVQRYLSESSYGIDFLRNGRKIEIGNKEVFDWVVDEFPEKEYPIDDPRAGGRFVGEIHIDHCRVHYTKTHFEKTDPGWAEMIEVLRGRGPLRPEKARAEGFSPNHSQLYRLYQAYRRSSPRQRNGVGWCRLLRVKDNARAIEMAKLFGDGHPEYQEDSKWWELCQADDARQLREEEAAPGDDGLPSGFVDEDPLPDPAPVAQPQPAVPQPAPPQPPPQRQADPELSRDYEAGAVKFSVEALVAQRSDPNLDGKPWSFQISSPARRTYRFLYDRMNPVFRSATFTPRDALLAEMASATANFTRNTAGAVEFVAALTELRSRHARSDDLEPRQLIQDSSQALVEFARSIVRVVDRETGTDLFNELSPEDQQSVLRRMAQRGVTDPLTFTATGGFLEFLDRVRLRLFFENRPELFLDGRYWDDPYSTLDFGDGVSTELARRRIVDRRANLLADAIWIADLDPSDLGRATREELIRASISIRLLRPDRELD